MQKNHTKGEVAKLLSARHMLALPNGRDDAPNHHRPDAYRENAPEYWAVDGHNFAGVLAVHV